MADRITPVYFFVPIKSIENAYAFMRALHADGLLFHPDDRPDTIIDGNGHALFTAAEAVLLTARMDEVFQYDPDPYAIGVDLINGDDCE